MRQTKVLPVGHELSLIRTKVGWKGVIKKKVDWKGLRVLGWPRPTKATTLYLVDVLELNVCLFRHMLIIMLLSLFTNLMEVFMKGVVKKKGKTTVKKPKMGGKKAQVSKKAKKSKK